MKRQDHQDLPDLSADPSCLTAVEAGVVCGLVRNLYVQMFDILSFRKLEIKMLSPTRQCHSPCSTPNWSRMKPSYLSQSSRTPPTTVVCVFSSLCWCSVLDILRDRATLYGRVVRNRSNDDGLRAPRKPGHTLLDAAPWNTKLPIRPSRGRSIQTAT